MKKQKENSHEGITWSEMGKQNVQAEKVYNTIVPTNSENRVCRSHEKLFIITGVNFLLLFLRISLNACFPTFVYVNKKSSHANCVRIIVLKFITSF